MTNLTATPGWDPVPLIATTTQLLGGVGGPLNSQAQALLDRTEAIAQGTLSPAAALTGAEVFTLSQSGGAYSATLSVIKTFVTSGTSGGLPDFTDTLNTAAPNAVIPVAALSATNSASNVDMTFAPKGAGAFILGPVPDSTTTGGNKRGTYATDLQLGRTAAAHVASGSNAFAAGYDNQASGPQAVSMGGSNVASGNYSVAIGTSNTASAQSSYAMGQACTASGQYGFAGGYSSVASSQSGVALGQFATTGSVLGKIALGSYSASSAGQIQRSYTNLRVVTTSTTATVATIDGAAASTSNQLSLPNNKAFRVRLYCVARDSTNGTDAKEWSGDILILKGTTAASTTIVGSNVASTFATSNASGWTLVVAADTANGALKITVTSSTTDSVSWGISLEAVELS